MLQHEAITDQIIGCAIKVHKKFGAGLLENVYEACLEHELTKLELKVQRQLALPVIYDEIRLEIGFRIDLLVEGCIIVEVKAVERILPIHEAQLLTYLRLSGHRVGLLINFNVEYLKQGILRRVV